MKSMRKFGAAGAAAILALLVAGCSSTPPDTREADAKALRDLETQWNQELAAKDVDKATANYTDDAVVMDPGMPASSGKDAIRKTFQEMLADPAMSLKFTASKVEVAKSGDLAYTQGSYTMTMTDPKSKRVVDDHGSYVTTYRKQAGGGWKAVMDISTSEAPPTSAAPVASRTKKAVRARRRR
jgi:uncharacterized protein (TIGR02246 family)